MFRNLPFEVFNTEVGLRERLRLAVLGDFESVDVDMQEAAALSGKYSAAYVKGMIDSFNMKAGAWLLPFALDSEEKIYKAGLEEIKRYGRIASEIGAFTVIAILQADVFEKECRENTGFYRERLDTVAGILNDSGCRIGVDFTSSLPVNRCHFSLDKVLELCSSVKSGNAGIILDAYYWHLSGGDTEGLKKTAGSFGVYARICDADSGTGRGIYLPGETGVIDLAGFLTALSEGGYQGPVSPKLPDRNILALPYEIAIRLLGGSFARIWKKAFMEKEG